MSHVVFLLAWLNDRMSVKVKICAINVLCSHAMRFTYADVAKIHKFFKQLIVE